MKLKQQIEAQNKQIEILVKELDKRDKVIKTVKNWMGSDNLNALMQLNDIKL